MKKILTIIIFMFIFALPSAAEVKKISMDDAVDLALKNNLALNAKRKEADILKQDIKIVNALKNPQFQSNFLIGKVSRGNSSQFGIALPIEIAKRGPRKKVAEAKLKLIENEIHKAELDLKIEVMEAYFNVLYLKSVVYIMEERMDLLEDMHDISKNRKPDKNYKIDLLQSNIRCKKQAIQLNQARANLISAQFHLNDTFNLEDTSVMYDTQEDTLFEDLAILDLDLPEYDSLEAVALVCSYSLRIADSNLDISEQELTVAKHKVIPDLTLTGGTAYQTAHQTGGESMPGAFVGAYFDIPVLYTYRPDVRKANLVLERANMDRKSFENRLKIALKQDYNDFKYAKENMKYDKDILSSSDEILQMSKQRYKKGDTSLINLMYVENSHQSILNEYINAMQVYYMAYLDLMHNVGNDILIDEEVFNI